MRKTARTARNMTQMALADEMGVSYQAVSNWERGNSMPDIAKLEDLCRVLEISIGDLLGADAPAAAAVEKVLDTQEDLTVEELTEIAPLLPPDRVEEEVRKNTAGEGKPLNIHTLGSIAPFLDEKCLDELADNAQVDSLAELVGIGPFLSAKALDSLVERRIAQGNLQGMTAMYPFPQQRHPAKARQKADGAGGLERHTGGFRIPIKPYTRENTRNIYIKH